MAKPVLEELMQKGYVSGRISLGMTLLDIDDVQTAMMYRVSSLGVYVLSVEDDSNAAKAGIESGDRIVSVNGTEISSTSDVTAILDQMSVGDQMEITIERSGRKGSATITLQEDKGSAA
jgi:serine protease Do